MNAGDIVHCENFRFSDGTTKNKYLILLNAPEPGDGPRSCYLFAKTTSQSARKPTAPGCYADRGLFLISAASEFFPLNTYVQFYPDALFEASPAKIASLALAQRALKTVGTLGEMTLRDLLDCILRSPDLIQRYQQVIRS